MFGRTNHIENLTTEEQKIFIHNINKHDVSAYKVLYKKYYQILVAYSFAMTSDQQVSEDIVQELFIKIWESDLKFLALSPFKAYLYNSVRNASLNHLRSLKVEQKHIESIQEMYRTMKTPYDMEQEEMYEHMYAEIDKMPKQMRKIFLMHLAGNTNDGIAGALRISVETVKTQKKRAKNRLKDNLGVSITIFLLLLVRTLYMLF